MSWNSGSLGGVRPSKARTILFLYLAKQNHGRVTNALELLMDFYISTILPPPITRNTTLRRLVDRYQKELKHGTD